MQESLGQGNPSIIFPSVFFSVPAVFGIGDRSHDLVLVRQFHWAKSQPLPSGFIFGTRDWTHDPVPSGFWFAHPKVNRGSQSKFNEKHGKRSMFNGDAPHFQTTSFLTSLATSFFKRTLESESQNYKFLGTCLYSPGWGKSLGTAGFLSPMIPRKTEPQQMNILY